MPSIRRLFVAIMFAIALIAPTHAAPAVTIKVNCYSSPESVTVTNATTKAITVSTITSWYQPRTNEPFRVARAIPAGKSAVFTAGRGATGLVLTKQYIFENDVGQREGVTINTTAGKLTAACRK